MLCRHKVGWGVKCAEEGCLTGVIWAAGNVPHGTFIYTNCHLPLAAQQATVCVTAYATAWAVVQMAAA